MRAEAEAETRECFYHFFTYRVNNPIIQVAIGKVLLFYGVHV